MTSVSVIIPIFNKEDYIQACLDSVLKQTLENIEVICINDGSTDNSANIVKQYQEENANIILINKENTGVGDSRNIGMDLSTGKYICFMDPDDFYPNENVLKKLFESAENNATKICGGSFSSLKKGELITKFSGLNKKYTFEKEGLTQYSDYQFDYGFQRFLFDRDMVASNNIRFPTYIRFQDPPFFVECMAVAKEFYALTDVVYCYREAYKELNWNLSRKIDLLRGLRHCIELSNRFDLMDLQKQTCSRITSDYYKNIFFRNDNRYECSFVASLLRDITEMIAPVYEEFIEEINRMIKTVTKNLPTDANHPMVSVIVPVYNVSEYIEECLDSILKQTFHDFEVICVDDGSPDNSGDICEEYAGRDARIRVVHKFNGGLSSARNSGADFATGEYFYFLDSDDMITENALEVMFSTMKKDSLDVLFFDAITFFESKTLEASQKVFKNNYSNRMPATGVLTGVDLFDRFLQTDAFRSPVQLSVVKKDFYESNNISCYPGILHEDNLYTFQVLMIAERAMYINKELYKRRVRDDSIMTAKKTFRNFYGYFKCYTEMYETLEQCDNEKERKVIEAMIDRTKKAAKVVFDELTPSEKSRIDSFSPEDRERIGFDLSDPDLPIEENETITVIILSENKDKINDTIHNLSQQTVWNQRYKIISEILNPHDIPEAIIYGNINQCISDIDSPYVAVCDVGINMDPDLFAHALEGIHQNESPFTTFRSKQKNVYGRVTVTITKSLLDALLNHKNTNPVKVETNMIFAVTPNTPKRPYINPADMVLRLLSKIKTKVFSLINKQ